VHDGPYFVNHDNSQQTNKWILFRPLAMAGAMGRQDRKLLIDRDGILSLDPGAITWAGLRHEVKLATATSVFVENPEQRGPDLELEEYDISSGRKLRTITFGATRGNVSMVAPVLSNDKEGFCLLDREDDTHEILSFLL